MIHKYVLSAFFVALVLALGAAPGTAADWQGKEVTKDGVLHIMNPAQPAESPTETELSERWRLGGDTEDEDEFFGVISEIATDADGNVYLLDSQLHQVMIYTSGGEFIRAIGREGEGPGEFRRPSGMIMLPGGNIGVVQTMPGKIIGLTTDGLPADNYDVPATKDGGTQMFFSCRAGADRVVVATNEFVQGDDGFTTVFRLIGVTPDGKKVAEYMTNENKHNMASFEFDEKDVSGFAMNWEIGPDGRIYANSTFDGYQIEVFRPDGEKDRVIEREYEPRVRTDQEIEDARERIKIVINGREAEKKMSKTDRDVQKLYTRHDGTIWVLSSRGALEAPEGTIGTFDVFNPDGLYTNQVTIKGDGSIERDGYFFVEDRLYIITHLNSARRAMYGGGGGEEESEEDVEPISIICYDIGAPQHGMR